MSVALALLLAAEPQLPIVTSPDGILELVAQSPRPTVVHFWASWCATCVRELPRVRELEQRVGTMGVPFLWVSLDSPDSLAKVVDFMQQHRLLVSRHSRAVLLDAPDPGPFATRFDPRWDGSLPATFVVLQSGVVAASHLGPTPLSTVLNEVRDQINAGASTPARSTK